MARYIRGSCRFFSKLCFLSYVCASYASFSRVDLRRDMCGNVTICGLQPSRCALSRYLIGFQEYSTRSFTSCFKLWRICKGLSFFFFLERQCLRADFLLPREKNLHVIFFSLLSKLCLTNSFCKYFCRNSGRSKGSIITWRDLEAKFFETEKWTKKFWHF